MFKNDPNQPEFVDFYLPFGGKLSASNRWVKLAEAMPWNVVEECCASSLAGTGMGAPAKRGRMAYGALIIKERLGVTDEETVEQIKENPYLQYFLGLHQYEDNRPFDPSMMAHFRSRFNEDHHRKINDTIIDFATKEENEDDDPKPPSPDKTHGGKLLIDATCAPADITYPTDLGLLNEAREKTEAYTDILHEPHKGKRKKPGTYRKKARRRYLNVAKQKRPGKRKIRTAIGQQLRYVKRNLGHIDKMPEHGSGLDELSRYQLRCLQVIHTLCEQQPTKYEQGGTGIPDRIVSIGQPHVRPIVRGKKSNSTEFGAKISVSHQADGYVSLDRLSWDAYNEHSDLIPQAERYKERFGYYPESVRRPNLPYQSQWNLLRREGHTLQREATGPPQERDPRKPRRTQATTQTTLSRRSGSHPNRRQIR